ncbi:glucose-6-phosphatase catalytic subunit 1 [Phlebotomus papatasi]|uniref:glucose-6-phosphatase catalytic subunit 1 n=1 Tax=Phlebotomus papatasi TaxID=29031 RepID=UPI0024844577|nr:glucose-6-phosphatase catalytic subunit 1 [Phlebotomus papatasi]
MDCKIYKYEIPQIVFLQNMLHSYPRVFLFINYLLNSETLFNILIPILSGLDKDIFLRTIIGGLLADFLNSHLKWLLAEPRPHWWVLGESRRPRLVQYEGTCECTPGSPSGEAMVTAAVFFILISRLLGKFEYHVTKCWKKVIWMAYAAILILLTVSQIFLGVHFPHQCIFGVIAGLIIGGILSIPRVMDKIYSLSKIKCFTIICMMFLCDCATYMMQIYLGVDPNWSTRLAFKYCENAKAILPESLIMYSLIRNLGIFVGILSFAPLNVCRPCVSDSCKLFLRSILKIILGMLGHHYIPRHYGVYIFYGSTVSFYAVYYFILYWIFTLKWPRKLEKFD